MKTPNPFRILAMVAAIAASCLYFSLMAGPAAAPDPEVHHSSGFKVTFGLKQKNHGANWSGGVTYPEQVRSIAGWHLDVADKLRPPSLWDLQLRMVAGDVAPKAVILDVLSPETRPVTLFSRRGEIKFIPGEIPYGRIHYPEGFPQDVAVERVPIPQVVSSQAYEDDSPALLRTRSGDFWLAWVAYKTRGRDGYFLQGADEIMVARSRNGRTWSPPESIAGLGDHFRVALGEDSRGRVWCVYGRQQKMESGNFDLYGRLFNQGAWSDAVQLTDHPLPDTFHRMAADSRGNLYLVWMGFRPAPEKGAPQSDIMLRVLRDGNWGPEVNLSQSASNDWEPAVAADSSGRAWVAWDSYRESQGRPADYDVLLRSYQNGSPGNLQVISATPLAEMRADVAVDGADRLWIAWEEGSINWGKDFGYRNPKHRINLKEGGSRLYSLGTSGKDLPRRPRVAVYAGGRLQQPRAEVSEAFPPFVQAALFQNPRLGVDGQGRIWIFMRHQHVAQGRNGGHLFDFYATTPTGDGWLNPILLPGSTGRQDTVLAAAPGPEASLVLAVVGDGRRLPVCLPENHDISTLVLNGQGMDPAEPKLDAFQPSPSAPGPATHPREESDVNRVRAHRVTIGKERYKVLRGDFHRHTEISMDGAMDGSLWDCYRYALDAAAFDFLGVSDHNYGAWLDTDEPESPNTDDVYQWWRTQKSADLFHVPGRFVPIYGYERSVNFPLGHRNIFHSRRGIFSYRVAKLHVAERPDVIEKDAQGLWGYLRATDGVGIPHTSGTTMGTDWRLRDDEVIPVTEIYQGDRNSYEEEGAPRAALPDNRGPGNAGGAPYQAGLIWNALGVGYRMGFIASSDHISTHISYANLLVPDGITTREDVLEALRRRHTYASTDNIILDFSAAGVLQGEETAAGESPKFAVNIVGTAPILNVEIIKNNRVIYTRRPEPGSQDPGRLSFTFLDLESFGGGFADTSMHPTTQIRDWAKPETGIRPRPDGKESYYYIRVVQQYSPEQPDVEGEVAWSSPIYVRHR